MVNRILNVCLIICLALYVFSLPAFSALPKWNAISYLLMAVLIILVLGDLVITKSFVFKPRLLILMFFVLESLIGTVFFSHEFRRWFTIVLLYITFLVFYYSFSILNNKRLLLTIISWSLFAFGMYFAFHYRTSILRLDFTESLGSYFDNVNNIGTYFSIGSTLFLYLSLSSKNKVGWLLIIPSLIMLVLGLFTGSRHFIITTGVAYISTVIVVFKRKKWLVLLIVVCVIALFFLMLRLPQLAAIKERIDRGITTLFGIGNAKYDSSSVQRTIWPQYGFQLGARHMLFGYGAEGYSIYSGVGTYSHNVYSEIVCNFGLLGLIIFYFSFFYPFALAIKSKSEKANIVIVVVVFYVVKGFFGVYFATKDAYMMLAMLFYLTKDYKFGDYVGLNARNGNLYKEYSEVSI